MKAKDLNKKGNIKINNYGSHDFTYLTNDEYVDDYRRRCDLEDYIDRNGNIDGFVNYYENDIYNDYFLRSRPTSYIINPIEFQRYDNMSFESINTNRVLPASKVESDSIIVEVIRDVVDFFKGLFKTNRDNE